MPLIVVLSARKRAVAASASTMVAPTNKKDTVSDWNKWDKTHKIVRATTPSTLFLVCGELVGV